MAIPEAIVQGMGRVVAMRSPSKLTSNRLALNNGVQMDRMGYGLYKVPAKDAEALVATALGEGYRRFDTAAMYGNEVGGVGRALGGAIGDAAEANRGTGGSGESVHALAREDLFVTTKVWNDDQGYDATLRAFDTSMANLGLDYVDLYLITGRAPAGGCSWKATKPWKPLQGRQNPGHRCFQFSARTPL